jgi:hypothetical protein
MGIRRSYNYKSCSKLYILSPQFFWEFFSSLIYFLGDISISAVICEWKIQFGSPPVSGAGPTYRGVWGHVDATRRPNSAKPHAFKGLAVPTGPV